MDVFGTLDLWDHDDVELVANLGDRRNDVVETPRGIERVHTSPKLGLSELNGLTDVHQTSARCFFVRSRNAIFKIAEQDVDG